MRQNLPPQVRPEDAVPHANGIGQPVRRKEDVRLITGAGRYSDDLSLPNQAHAAMLRSPHAHARIVSIDTSKAEALPGVRAVVTSKDFPDIKSEEAFVGEGPMNFRDLSRNILARDKALYEGHASPRSPPRPRRSPARRWN